MSLKRNLFILLFLCGIICRSYGYNSDMVSKNELAETIKYLSGIKSRVVGYPGLKTAEEYIYNKLKAIGIKNLKKEPFKVVSPVEEYADLKLNDGRKIKLHCLWPNQIRTSTVKIDKANLVYGGDGNLNNLNGKQITGNIVMLDFNCNIRWINIAKLDAAAILFVEPDTALRREAELKFLGIPLNIPRFWISKNDANILFQKLKSAKTGIPVSLKAKMTWTEVDTSNIFGYIKGTDPELSKEIIIIQSYYDSISVVPALAPGAETSCGIASLIQLAKYFKNNPPKRTLMFLATSGHFIQTSGIIEFFYKHLIFDKYHHVRLNSSQDINEAIDNIKLLFALDITSQNNEIAMMADPYEKSQDYNYREAVKQRLNIFASRIMGNLANTRLPQDLDNSMLLPAIKIEKGKSPQALIPWMINSLDTMPAIMRGVSAIGFVTTYDGRLYVDTPLDSFEKVNLENVYLQTKLLVEAFSSSLNTKSITEEPSSAFVDCGFVLELRIVSFDPKKGFEPNNPLEGAFGYFSQNANNVSWGEAATNCGVRSLRFYKTDKNGIALITNRRSADSIRESSGFMVDPETGAITYAPDRGVYGDEQFPLLLKNWQSRSKQKITLFECNSLDIYDFIDPQYLIRLSMLDILGKDNAIPPSYGYMDFGKTAHLWSSFDEPYAVAFMDKSKDMKVILSAGAFGKRNLFINAKSAETKEAAEGIGFPLSTTRALYDPVMQATKDMFNLDDYRIRVLKERSIKDKFLEDTHATTERLIELAQQSKANLEWDKYAKYSQQALGQESRLYPDVKDTMNDVVRGIIFYMILMLPFAYFTERLIFSFVSTTKRILGVAGTFLVIYLIMRNVHPAFKLATAPEIILLGFIVFVLAFIVFAVIQGKFEEQIGKINKEEAKGLYVTDVGRISAMGVAFSLGISNMKKYKVRTFLTSLTVVLLTFTILSFTSIQTRMGYMKVKQKGKPSYNGFLFKDTRGWPLELASYEYLKNEYAGENDIIISPRAEYNTGPYNPGTPSENTMFINIKSKQGKETDVTGVLGINPEETRITNIFIKSGRFFEPGEVYSCVLPEEIAGRLNVGIGDTVRMFGSDLRLVGIIDSNKLSPLKDLDNESILPVDFTSLTSDSMSELAGSRTSELQSIPLPFPLRRVDSKDLVILPYDFVMGCGGILRSVSVKFTDKSRLEKSIDELMKKLSTTLYVGLGDDIYAYSSLKTAKIGGFMFLFIPIFIAALIILNTMLGSVYERIRDIGIYSSVGLAPTHISMLFFGESCVYSVLGAVLGYLLGQVVVKILTVLKVLSGLNLNYSSTSTVFVTLFVILVVFLSTLYPAKKAADMSVPDVTRKWNIPKPAGDNWNFLFPFTVSGIEVLGLFTFMKSFFDSFTEESVGNFYTSGTGLKKTEKGYVIENIIWLSPYDLGVKQHFELGASKTEDEGEIFEIRVKIDRLEGDVRTWTRLNRQFLNSLRKEFLVWRTVNLETKEEYKKEGRALIGLA